jgi:hypothetical protein
MLAASEAEAQREPSNAQILDALRQDRDFKVNALIADKDACTVDSDATIKQLDVALKAKGEALTTAKAAVTALEAADGAWGLANAARTTSVKAAVDKETESNIAGLLDAMDVASAAERAAAATYGAADKAYQAGVRTAATAA